ncbi:LPXTG cell wall anchor domain-containing protein [Salicibibacter cibarius]|uniref:LPXTG cell wall anchor domain-containing protein n=1 Tax=Salicibibacter cibarius TaxID=2743000 RepID=A0A7T7CA85_9BACI|nr:DUF6230 family protein [Salicibibacter cibarius]QQK74600.1 LPXTG cell wall anchor domain-containing protein [Salicibibacter cibarius]
MEETERMAFGRTVKKRVFAALVAGFLLLGGMVATLGMTGTAFALPLGGIGDFNVSFDELEGEGFSLNPNIGETGDADAAPLVRNQIDRATIDGLHIYKDLPMPGGDWIRINIAASEPTTIEGLVQDARFVDADLNFTEMGMGQTNTSDMSPEDAFRENWSSDADTVTITDGEIITSYLFQNMVSLQGAQIYIDFIDEPDSGAGSPPSIDDSGTASTTTGDGGGSSIDTSDSDSDRDGESETAAGPGSSGDSDASGGALPSTAGNTVVMILIGLFAVAIGSVFVFRKRIFAA